MFTPNISTRGRLLRGLLAAGLLLGAGALLLTPHPWPTALIALCLALALAGLFTLFEAVKGWCVLRACGIKTRV